jgi:4a-hydroxytetrahydrobiopterin dehydratase
LLTSIAKSKKTEAIAFVNRLVSPAESLGHHPDIIINYNRVTLSLTTHEVGGLSNLDFDLARKIDRLIP